MDIQQSHQLELDIKNLIQSLKGVELESLKREGRDFDFTDVFPYIKNIYENLDELSKAENWLSLLPLTEKQALFNSLNSFSSIISQINSFTPSQIPNPQEHRNNLATTLNNLYASLYKQLIEPMRAESLSRRSKNTNLSNISKKAEEELQKIENTKGEVESLLNSAKKVATQTGVTVYSGVFETQANKNRGTAKRWLIAAIVISIGLLIMLSIITYETVTLVNQSLATAKNLNATNILTLLLAKLFLATIGYYLLYQSIKNFNVNMHLFSLNTHRANVMVSFESFIKSTDDAKVRDIVLIKAVEAIFNSGDTGYLSGKENSSKDGTELLLPLLENLTKR